MESDAKPLLELDHQKLISWLLHHLSSYTLEHGTQGKYLIQSYLSKKERSHLDKHRSFGSRDQIA